MELIYKNQPLLSGEILANGIPKGGIILWSGSADEVPFGWAICDGKNGTFDLRNRFVIGAGGEYPVGDIGGESEHTLTVDEMPAHTHAVRVFHTPSTSLGTAPARGSGDYTDNIHAIQSAGGSQPHNNLPPYYALCYIQYIGETISDGLEIENYTTDDGWRVRKWSDGYLELSLLRTIHIEPSSFNTSGNVYVSGSAIFDYVTYPIPFQEIHSKNITPVQGAGGFWCMSPGFVNPSPLTQTDRTHIVRTTLPTEDVDYTASYHITGRWK